MKFASNEIINTLRGELSLSKSEYLQKSLVKTIKQPSLFFLELHQVTIQDIPK